MVSKTPDIPAIEKAARGEGMTPLREAAIKKMLQGMTTYEEVVSVT